MKIAALDIGIVVVYVGLMFGFAVYYAFKKTSDIDDYYLGGKQLSIPILMGTIVSTYFGVDSLAGNAEMGFSMGISGFFSYCFTAWILMLVLAYLGGKIKDHAGDAFSPSDIITKTYGKSGSIASAFGSLAYSIPVVEVMGLGLVFKIVFGMEYWQGVLLTAIISVLFTYFGGMIAVAITDMINLAIISIGVALAGIIGWVTMGSDRIWEGLEIFAEGDPSFYFMPSGGWITAGIFFTYSASALSILCEPALFQRILAARDSSVARKAFALASFIYVAYALVTVVMGIMTAASIGLGEVDYIHPSEALITFGVKILPTGVFGLFLAGYLAAGVSSLDSYYLVAGNTITSDIIGAVSVKERDDETKLKMTKRGVIVACLISVALAFYFGRIMGAWVLLSGLLINSTLVPLYTAMFMKGKKYPIAGNASAVFGILSTIIYYITVDRLGYYDEYWGTRMIDLKIFGTEITLWQEYNIFIILPIVLVLYFVLHFAMKLKER